MFETLNLALIFLLLGCAMGGAVGWLVARLQRPPGLSREELTAQYVPKTSFEQLQAHADIAKEDLREKEEEIRLFSSRLASQEQVILNLEEKLGSLKEETAALQERARLEFESLANRLLEEKSQKFTLQNHEQLHGLLGPLREKIKSFEEGIEKRFLEETKDRVSLKKEIEHLRELNQQLSQDANNLASALKGDNKAQGDWGELQLELLLERAGLTKGIHFESQPSFVDENGQLKRPDFLVYMPQGKHLLIDSKVSLKAYDRFLQADSEAARRACLKAHVESIRQHVRGLRSKNYTQLYQIDSPDYLLLFVPIEPALALALQEDQHIFLDALEQHIVIVSATTLLATMRTVSFIWKQEKQKGNVLEIARQSGLLYDKFVGFVEDLKAVGQRLDQAQGAYRDAMNKLTDSKKFGDTLVGRAERVRELGARTSKSLPKDLLDAAEEEGLGDG